LPDIPVFVSPSPSSFEVLVSPIESVPPCLPPFLTLFLSALLARQAKTLLDSSYLSPSPPALHTPTETSTKPGCPKGRTHHENHEMKPRTQKKRKTTDCFDSTQTKTWNASVAQRVHDEEEREREREKLGHDGQEGYDSDGLEEGIAHRLPHLLLLALDAEGNVPGSPAGDYDLPLHALLPPHL